MNRDMREPGWFASGGGDMGERIRGHDWAATPLGPPERWPHALHLSLGICLNSSFPIAIYWGPGLHLLYNDGWSPIPGKRHPHALGQPAHLVWPDIWPIVGPQFADVIASGRGYSTADQHLPMTRSGRLEESYWDYSFTPITGDDGRVAGILNQGHEVTDRVFERQRHALLLPLADRLRAIDDADAIAAAAVDALGAHLGCARAGYAEMDLAAGTYTVTHNWRRDADVAELRGTHALGAFGVDLHDALSTGAVFAVDDALEDRRVAGRPVAERYRAAGIRAGLVVPVLKGGQYAAAIFVHDDAPRCWTNHHETLLSSVAERIWEERGRARSARSLRESEGRYRLIFEQANDIIFTADLTQTITAANPAAGAALGVPPDALTGRSIAEFVAPDDLARTSGMLRRKLAAGGTTRYEVPVIGKDGASMRWDINSSLAIDDAGQPTGLHAIARDVTERHAHEESQRRLINELNHRVKNMLALVQALAMQSFKGDRPVEESQAGFQARLAALASAHDLLTREKWEGATLQEIVGAAVLPLAPERDRVAIGGPAVALAPKLAVSLVMAFHELATNAIRYGALAGEAGAVDVHWDRLPGGRLAIGWHERGGPPVAPPARRGFGLRMVERVLAKDLAAKVAIDFPATGFSCLIEAPLPAPAAGIAA
ncbi:sensor histidine kinase [Sphingomonas profundi]|uniref:sensor histidine kinase n=1 Tax=Alterirhizorhabdus profundi TaxID=2681549 RepID=UPI0012E8C747|nr:HWE histidine kinase domain-containing protein [Sphingomonas profundi]